MENSTTIVFQTTFTGRGKYNGFRGQEWYSHRAEIFKKYTARSLAKQTDKDFLWWLCFRPEEKDNPTTNKIEKSLKETGLNYIMTFDGQIMYDDRNEENNKTLLKRTKRSLREIENKLGLSEYVYEVHLDSDDMMNKEFVETIKEKPFKWRGALFVKQGFVYTPDDRLAHWHNPRSSNNYTIMYPKSIYLDADKRYEYQNGFQSHEQVPDKFNAVELPSGMFCTLIHGNNISTLWKHPFMGEEIFYDNHKSFILKDFL